MFKFTIIGDKPIYAYGFRDFLEKFRNGSFFPEKDMKTFMQEVSKRSRFLSKVPIRTDSEEHFVQDLISIGFVGIEDTN